MKCLICGKEYNGTECPNCSELKELDSNDAGINTEVETQKNPSNIWSFFIKLSLIFGTLGFAFVLLIGEPFDIAAYILGASISSAAVFLLFWYLEEIRQSLIKLNKKKDN